MTGRPQAREVCEMNALLLQDEQRQQQEPVSLAKDPASGQFTNPEEKTPRNPNVSDSGSTKPEDVGNPECRRCKLMKECRGMWKATHRKHSKEKPAIIAGIVHFVDENAPDMVCLSRPTGDD